MRLQKLAAGQSAALLYQRTMDRLWQLEHTHGYELHVVWGCELRERLRSDRALRQLYNGIFVPQRPLDPRADALRGGRTEPFKLYHNCAPNEEIICIDIVCIFFHPHNTVFCFNRFHCIHM